MALLQLRSIHTRTNNRNNKVHDLSNEYVRALLVGHNPGLEQLVELLTGEMHPMPTCSLAHLKLRVDKWSAIGYKIKGQVAEIWRPRDLT